MKVLSLLSDLTNNEYQLDELNIVHDDSEVSVTEFGRLTTNVGGFVGAGFGTYYPHIDGTTLKVDFIPETGIAVTCNTITVGLGSESIVGFGTEEFKHAFIDGRSTAISASGTPGITTVGGYTSDYDAAYFVVAISDTTNDTYEMRELIVLDDDSDEDGVGTAINFKNLVLLKLKITCHIVDLELLVQELSLVVEYLWYSHLMKILTLQSRFT